MFQFVGETILIFNKFIYIRIFKTHEEIKYLWIFASNLETEEEMLKNSQFCYHAKKLGDSINTVVLALTSINVRVILI